MRDLTAINQGTWHKLFLLLLINYHDYNYLLFQTVDISLSTLDLLLSILDSRHWLRLGEGKTFISQLFLDPELWSGSWNLTHHLSLCSRRSTDWANYVAVKDKSEVMTKVQRVYSYSWTFWGLIPAVADNVYVMTVLLLSTGCSNSWPQNRCNRMRFFCRPGFKLSNLVKQKCKLQCRLCGWEMG